MAGTYRRSSSSSASSGNVELGYAEITADYDPGSLTFPTLSDVPGLSVTVTVGTRPIVVEWQGDFQNANGAGYVIVYIREGSTTLTQAAWYADTLNNQTNGCKVRLAPPAGSHTYKVTITGTGASSNPKIIASATNPSFLQVVEV